MWPKQHDYEVIRLEAKKKALKWNVKKLLVEHNFVVGISNRISSPVCKDKAVVILQVSMHVFSCIYKITIGLQSTLMYIKNPSTLKVYILQVQYFHQCILLLSASLLLTKWTAMLLPLILYHVWPSLDLCAASSQKYHQKVEVEIQERAGGWVKRKFTSHYLVAQDKSCWTSVLEPLWIIIPNTIP